MDDFAAEISRASAVEGPAIELGRGVLDGALPAPEARAQELGVPWTPTAFPAEYLGGGGQLGDFLSSREGHRIHKEVMRGMFELLRKRL